MAVEDSKTCCGRNYSPRSVNFWLAGCELTPENHGKTGEMSVDIEENHEDVHGLHAMILNQYVTDHALLSFALQSIGQRFTGVEMTPIIQGT